MKFLLIPIVGLAGRFGASDQFFSGQKIVASLIIGAVFYPEWWLMLGVMTLFYVGDLLRDSIFTISTKRKWIPSVAWNLTRRSLWFTPLFLFVSVWTASIALPTFLLRAPLQWVAGLLPFPSSRNNDSFLLGRAEMSELFWYTAIGVGLFWRIPLNV